MVAQDCRSFERASQIRDLAGRSGSAVGRKDGRLLSLQKRGTLDDIGAQLYAGRMQFRQLRYFVKIVDAGSFSRAASVVHVAQPALSKQIAELEERLGVGLLSRRGR